MEDFTKENYHGFYGIISRMKKEKEEELKTLDDKIEMIQSTHGEEYTKTIEFKSLVYGRIYLTKYIEMLDDLTNLPTVERIRTMSETELNEFRKMYNIPIEKSSKEIKEEIIKSNDHLNTTRMQLELFTESFNKYPCYTALKDVSSDPQKAIETSILMTELSQAFSSGNNEEFEKKRAELQAKLGEAADLDSVSPFISKRQFENLITIAESKVWGEEAKLIEEIQKSAQLRSNYEENQILMNNSETPNNKHL